MYAKLHQSFNDMTTEILSTVTSDFLKQMITEFLRLKDPGLSFQNNAKNLDVL